MLFLGFTDDVLEWPWRYKLFLPSVASLPLLCCYEGSRSVVVPIPLRQYLMSDGRLTAFGRFLCHFVVIDQNSDGSIVYLGLFYLLYMGALAVFCTNAINIHAGINGIEVGQSYIIGCAVLYHNLVEIQAGSLSLENHLFSAMIMLSFLGVSLALLRHNWYPASVFVGDTYCYFAGMVRFHNFASGDVFFVSLSAHCSIHIRHLPWSEYQAILARRCCSSSYRRSSTSCGRYRNCSDLSPVLSIDCLNSMLRPDWWDLPRWNWTRKTRKWRTWHWSTYSCKRSGQWPNSICALLFWHSKDCAVWLGYFFGII